MPGTRPSTHRGGQVHRDPRQVRRRDHRLRARAPGATSRLGSPVLACVLRLSELHLLRVVGQLACYLPRVAGDGRHLRRRTRVADCSQQFPDRYDNPSWRCPETAWSCGATTRLRANSDGFYGHWIIDLMKRGMKIMMVDPRVTWLSPEGRRALAARASRHRRGPGASAMLNVIINEDLYDHDFVRQVVLRLRRADRARAGVSARQGVPRSAWVPGRRQIVRAARLSATSKPAAIQWGLAAGPW